MNFRIIYTPNRDLHQINMDIFSIASKNAGLLHSESSDGLM